MRPTSPPNPVKLDELLTAYPFLRDVHSRLQSDPANEALRRVALARTCTKALYDEVLKGELSLPFDELIQRPEIEPVPQTPGVYWLREAAQREAMESWATDPEGRAQWAERVHGHAKSSGAEPLELAMQKLRFAPEKARDDFRRLYDEADAANDLPRCNLIVETLHSLRADMAGTPMDDDRREYASRYAARAMFLVEYHRTFAFHPRVDAAQALQDVLAEKDGQWILHLFAAGGMGKTMFLQAAISRTLVTSPERALVARLDMDFLSVNALMQCPWLMAIEIGRQIDRQLREPAFARFLASVEAFSGLLYSPVSERYQALSRTDAQSLILRARNESTNWLRLTSILSSLPRERKIVILLDTIEEVSLYYPDELRAIVRHFEKLKESVPQLRLVLSGRYELGREHLVGAWDEAIANVTRPCELEPFPGKTAKTIASARLAAKPKALVAAVVRSAGGFPFKLAMLIELVLDNPRLRAKDIDEHRDADVAYVIERVIKRIGLNDARRGESGAGTANEHQSLRWVVRYGVVPRKLTLSFLKNVMQPHLERALSGESRKTGTDAPKQDAWNADPEAETDPGILWQDLTNYSSERGWIVVDPHDPELASFHPDIVNPLRKLVRDQRVFVPLHQDGAQHFRARADVEPGRWAEWKAAELYHLCAVGEFVRAAAVISETFAGEPSIRAACYEDILKSRDFETLPSALRADVGLAFADAVIAADLDYDYARTGAARERIARDVLAAQTLHPEKTNGRFWDLWLNVGSLAVADLVSELEARQLSTYLTDADRQRLGLLLAGVHPESSARVEALESGRGIAERSQDRKPLVPAWVFWRRLSQEHERAGNPHGARDHAAAAVDALRGTQNPVLVELRTRLATIDISMLRLERAQQTVLQADQKQPDLRRLNARIHLIVENPWGVNALLPRDAKDPEDLLLLAQAAAQRLDITESLALHDRAEQAFEKAGSTTGLNRVRISRLRFVTLDTGIEPRSFLDTCPPSDQAGETELLRAYANLEHTPGYAASLLQTLAEHESAAVRARALIAALVWRASWSGPDGLPNAAERLVETLKTIRPASARLALLEAPLLDGSAFANLPEQRVGELVELFRAQPEGTGEASIYCLRYADLLRALGLYQDALDMLTQIRALPDLHKPNLWPLTAFRRRRLIEDRIRAVYPAAPLEVDPLSTWNKLSEDSVLHAAVLLETGDRALAAGDVATTKECLKHARAALKTPTRFAEQYRRLEASLAARRNVETIAVRPARRRASGNELAEGPRDALDPAATRSQDAAQERPAAGLEQPVEVVSRYGRRLLTWRSDLRIPRVISVVEDPALELVATSINVDALTELIIKDCREVQVQFAKVISQSWLVVPDPRMAAVPWELGGRPITRLAIADRSLRSDLAGLNATLEQLTSGLARQQWKPTRHKPARELAWVTLAEGADADSGTARAYYDVPRRFKQIGIEPVEFGKEQRASRPEAVPSLAYLASGIVKEHGKPVLAQLGLTAQTLGHMLAGGKSERKPVVVLDPPRPYALAEAVECLYWRNLFAAQLMDTGTVAAVVALGLAPYQEQRSNLDQLFEALREGSKLASLVDAIRGAAANDEALDRIIAFRAAALFTQDPHARARYFQPQA